MHLKGEAWKYLITLKYTKGSEAINPPLLVMSEQQHVQGSTVHSAWGAGDCLPFPAYMDGGRRSLYISKDNKGSMDTVLWNLLDKAYGTNSTKRPRLSTGQRKEKKLNNEKRFIPRASSTAEHLPTLRGKVKTYVRLVLT